MIPQNVGGGNAALLCLLPLSPPGHLPLPILPLPGPTSTAGREAALSFTPISSEKSHQKSAPMLETLIASGRGSRAGEVPAGTPPEAAASSRLMVEPAFTACLHCLVLE